MKREIDKQAQGQVVMFWDESEDCKLVCCMSGGAVILCERKQGKYRDLECKDFWFRVRERYRAEYRKLHWPLEMQTIDMLEAAARRHVPVSCKEAWPDECGA